MRAATLQEFGEPLSVEEVEEPELASDGVVVETAACGICRSDWHVWQGEWGWFGIDPQEGHIFGHEPAGEVVAVGDEVESVREGDLVAVPFNLGDGSCPMCMRGHGNHCDNGLPLGFVEPAPGAWAERFPVPWADYNCIHLPDGVDPVEMAGLGCRFVTAYHALAHRADVTPGDWVAVHGCGGVGLSAVHVADAIGANVVAVDLDPGKLEQAEDLGADETVDASEGDPVGPITDVTDGGADVSIDALGIAETCRNSVDCLERMGQHVQVGLTTEEEQGEIPLPTDAMVGMEVEFIGAYGMPPTRYDEIFRMVERGTLDPGAVVSETVGLEDVSDRLDAMTNFETEGIPVVTEFA